MFKKIIILLTLIFLFINNLVFSVSEDSLEVNRRARAISESIKSRVELLLNNYYTRRSYIVNVETYLEEIKLKKKIQEERKETEELNLPGLPTSAIIREDIIPGKTELIPSGDLKIKYINILIALDEKVFARRDIDFVRAIIRTQVGLSQERGDSLIVNTIPFPEQSSVNQKEVDQAAKDITETKEKLNEMIGLVNQIQKYLLWGLIGLLLIFLILFIYSMYKRRKYKKYGGMPPSQVVYPIPGEVHELPEAGKVKAIKPEKELERFISEMKHFIITTIVGSPELTSKILTNWIEVDPDNGVRDISDFLRITDPQLIDVLSEYTDNEVMAKVKFEIDQEKPIQDKEKLKELFVKFREEMQKEQWEITQAGIQGKEKKKSGVFNFLKQLPTESIYHIIKNEPDSIIAIALAQIPAHIAKTVLKDFPEDKQIQIPLEIAKMQKIPLSVYNKVADKLARKAMEAEKIEHVKTDGIEALINILEHSSPDAEKEILARIAGQDIDLAEKINNIYVSFDKISRMSKEVLSEILRDFDKEVIIRALIGSKYDVKEKILDSLPDRMRVIVGDSLETLEQSNEVSFEETGEARRVITRRIRELAKTGKIDLHKILEAEKEENKAEETSNEIK